MFTLIKAWWHSSSLNENRSEIKVFSNGMFYGEDGDWTKKTRCRELMYTDVSRKTDVRMI